MKEKGLPPELVKPVVAEFRKLKKDYRSIDRTFIARNFLSVEALIQRDEKLFGEGSYEKYVYVSTHLERIDEWRTISDGLHRQLVDEYEAKGQKPPLKYVKQILSHTEIPHYSKQRLLRRHFEQQYEELIAKYRPMLQEKAQEERRLLCSLWGDYEPVRLMMDKDLIPLRKEVFNTVMADAFGALGFEKRNRRKGVDFYFKPLTARYSIVVATDIPNLERIVYDPGPENDKHSVGIRLNWLTHIGSANKKDKTAWFFFYPLPQCYASEIYLDFKDPQSLEVCVRAYALYYELTIGTFEDIIRKYGNP